MKGKHFWTYRKVSLLIIGVLFVFFVSIRMWHEHDYIGKGVFSTQTVKLPPEAENEIISFNDDFTVDESFNTHLPIVVIDMGGQEPTTYAKWDRNSKTYVSTVDPETAMISCNVYLYDNVGVQNYLSDEPSTATNARIRYRGNSSLSYEKKQYLLKFVDDDGNNNDISVFGMGKESSWVLNGSMIDKSMLRNNLAYNVSSAVMENWVDCVYCEVLFRSGNSYEYMGVYSVIETVKQGSNRVDIGEYDEKYAATSYILRRDRNDRWKLDLNDYEREYDLAYGVLQVEYPNDEKITDRTLDYINNDISAFQKALYSENAEEFIKYRDFIDMNSFADYFIINEYFICYDAGFNSTYMYKDYGGKLKMGPTWDFDGAIDNYYGGPADYDMIAFQEAPWFKRMLLDPQFCDLLIKRYEELREGPLSDENIGKIIDCYIERLGKAQVREWARWGDQYINSTYLEDGADRHGVLHTNRNLNSFSDEIEKIKTVLQKHAEWLDKNTNILYLNINTVPGLEKEKILEADASQNPVKNWGAVLAVVFIAAFLITVSWVQRD